MNGNAPANWLRRSRTPENHTALAGAGHQEDTRDVEKTHKAGRGKRQ